MDESTHPVKPRPATAPVQLLLQYYSELYQQVMGVPYPVQWGRDGKMMKDLLATYPADQIKTYMVAFLALEDEFVQQSGFSLSVFRACLPKVIASLRRRPRAVGHYDDAQLERMKASTEQYLRDYAAREQKKTGTE